MKVHGEDFQIKFINNLSDEQIEKISETPQEKSILQNLSKAGFGHKENKFLLAATLNEQVVGVSAIAFAENRPWGSILYLKINQQLSTTLRLKLLRELVDQSFAFAEEKNCVRIYMANRLQRRGRFLNARLYPLVKDIERLKKYSFISESIIAANSKPLFEYEWQLLGFQEWPEDMGIVSATLKSTNLPVQNKPECSLDWVDWKDLPAASVFIKNIDSNVENFQFFFDELEKGMKSLYAKDRHRAFIYFEKSQFFIARQLIELSKKRPTEIEIFLEVCKPYEEISKFNYHFLQEYFADKKSDMFLILSVSPTRVAQAQRLSVYLDSEVQTSET